MRIAVCGSSDRELELLCLWLERLCALYGTAAELRTFPAPGPLLEAALPGAFQVALVGFGGSRGFLCARALRRRDGACRIILIDDTPEYSVRGLRLHFTDLIVRPLAFSGVVRSMKLAMGGMWQ